MKPIPYGRQHITEEDIKAVVETLHSDFLTQGPKIDEFEKKFAEYIGCKYAVAVANGTAALHLAALGLGVNKGSKVITSPLTFAASSNCILYCGGSVDFVDIDASSVLLDLDLLEEKLSKVKPGTYQGIVPVDFAGMAIDLERLKAIARKYQLWILEDACHAPGGFFTDSKGVKQFCGSCVYADAAIFSFHPVKHIACGEGGMITTNNKELYCKLTMLRTHGITKNPAMLHENHGGWYYEMQALGFNYRLTDFQAALGLSQLQRAEEGLRRRRAIAKKYDQAFANSSIETIKPPSDGGHAYHLYQIRTKRRKELYDYLKTKNIFTQVHYIPVHLQPYYQQLGFSKGMYPNSESFYDECLSLPMYSSLSDEEQDYVIREVLAF